MSLLIRASSRKLRFFINPGRSVVSGVRMSSCRDVREMSDEQVKHWIDSFDTVMTDCDGVLWVGSNPIPGSPQMIQRFRELGKRIFYVTNNSTKTRREYKEKIDNLGFGGDLNEVIGTAYLAAAYLEQLNFDKSKFVYVVGTAGITKELEEMGIKYLPLGSSDQLSLDSSMTLHGLTNLNLSSVSAVVFGFTTSLVYKDLVLATLLLSNPSVEFLLEAPDTTCIAHTETGDKVSIPCTGSLVKAVIAASGRRPVVLGKPSKFMFEIVQRRYPEIEAARTLMIGDRADTDIMLGKNCGLQTLLVGSGVHSLAETRSWEKSSNEEERMLVADHYIDTLGDLIEKIKMM